MGFTRKAVKFSDFSGKNKIQWDSLHIQWGKIHDSLHFQWEKQNSVGFSPNSHSEFILNLVGLNWIQFTPNSVGFTPNLFSIHWEKKFSGIRGKLYKLGHNLRWISLHLDWMPLKLKLISLNLFFLLNLEWNSLNLVIFLTEFGVNPTELARNILCDFRPNLEWIPLNSNSQNEFPLNFIAKSVFCAENKRLIMKVVGLIFYTK